MNRFQVSSVDGVIEMNGPKNQDIPAGLNGGIQLSAYNLLSPPPTAASHIANKTASTTTNENEVTRKFSFAQLTRYVKKKTIDKRFSLCIG